MENDKNFKTINILSKGYGIIPKKVMLDKELSIEAKAIYSFFCSFTGNGDTAFPSVSLITSSLGISRQRYNKHRGILEQKGYIKVTQQRLGKGSFKNNIYQLFNEVPSLQNPTTGKPTTDSPTTENITNNINSLKSNSINNNKEIKDNALFESWWDLYNKKKARPKALSAFNSALKKHDYETIEKGTINYLKSIEDKQYQSYPAKFLNQEQYMDEHSYKDNNVYENTTATGNTSVGHDYLDGL